MRYLFLCLLVMAIRTDAPSQQVNGPVKKLHFLSYNTVQLLGGNSITSFALQSVNGFQSGRFFAGLGVGYDAYFHGSVPLFIEPRVTVLKAKQSIQLYGQGGCNFPLSKPNPRFEFQEGPYKTGTYLGFGADCLLPVNKSAFIIGLGYSSKQIIQESSQRMYNPISFTTFSGPARYKYTLNRITIRVGWQF